MKLLIKSSSLLILLGILLMMSNRGNTQEMNTLRVMTFNIRYANPDDGFNAWTHRKEMAASMIRFHDAEIVGLQEALRSQLDDLESLLPRYDWFGVARTDGTRNPQQGGEFAAILYRTDLFERLDGGTFWLSETPDEVGSTGWDAALPRVVTWCLFRDKRSGARFYHFNTHFDHIGERARAESARLILRRIGEVAEAEAPVVLTGDFNCTPEELPYQVLTGEGAGLRDALTVSKEPSHGPLSTWSDFDFPGVPGRRIDYIFVNGRIEVERHGILSDSWSGRFPSDHLPVLVEAAFK